MTLRREEGPPKGAQLLGKAVREPLGSGAAAPSITEGDTSTKNFLSTAELAKRLRVQPRTILAWHERHDDFPGRPLVVGSNYVWPARDAIRIRAWVKARREPKPSTAKLGPAAGPHGSRSHYKQGCRHPDCVQAHRDYMRRYMRARRDDGDTNAAKPKRSARKK